MHPSATVSVLIPTYGRPAALERALGSLWRQTRPPEEVIVAAWAGDEPTRRLFTRLADQDRVEPRDGLSSIVLTEQNSVTAKENAALAAAAGRIVCFMDDDAIARPDWLERLVAHYLDPRVGAVGGRDVVWLDGVPLEPAATEVGRVRWFGRLIGNHHAAVWGAREVDFLKGVNMSFRRDLVTSLDERLAGAVPYGFEIDLGLQVRSLGYRVIYDPGIVVDHYPTTHYGADAPIAWAVNHNQTYVLLKRLPAIRKLAFLAYTFLLGDRNSIGLARVPLALLAEGWPPAAVAAHFAGKLAGLRTYLAAAARGSA